MLDDYYAGHYYYSSGHEDEITDDHYVGHYDDHYAGHYQVDILAGHYYGGCASNGWVVKCWGYNGYGTLGTDDTTQRSSARDIVQGLPAEEGINDVKCGYYHCCALTRRGRLFCWGYNNHGQLGDYSTTTRNTAVEVSSGSDTASTWLRAVSYTHLRAHETRHDLVCRLLLEKKK